MIGIVDCEVQALNPNMPLYPMRSYVSSPSSIRIRNVPRRIGKWCIENVYFTAVYPDGAIKSADCVLVGGVWVGTIEGTATSGTSKNGYTIFASGTDENGNAVNGYILGKGDIEILEADGTISPNPVAYYVHLLSAQSDTPKEGDLYPTLSGYMIWQNGEGHELGTSLNDEQIEAVNAEVERRETIIVLEGGITKTFNWLGTVSKQTLIDAELWDDINQTYAAITEIDFGTGVERIATELFRNCTTLGYVKFPSSLVKVESSAFRGCTSLVHIWFPTSFMTREQTENWGTAIFEGCTNLYDVEIPASIEKIPSSMFANCTSLSQLKIHNGVTTIGARAFLNTNLNGGTIYIPSSIQTIESNAFRDSSIADIYLTEGLRQIGASAFSNCVQLRQITIPSSVIMIAEDMFSGCINLTKIVFLGKSLDDVKDLGNYPFGLTPEQETLIETFNDRIADGSGNVIKADRTTIRAGESQWDVLATSSDIDAMLSAKQDALDVAQLSAVDLYADVIYTLFYVDGESQPYKILASDNMAKTDFESVGVYDSATGTWLKNINSMRAGTNVTQLATGLFSNVYTLRYFDGPNVTWPAATAFSGCSSLTSITLPKLVNLGIQCFKGCTALRKMTMPSTIANVGRNTFLSCADLSVTFEGKSMSQVQSIANYPWGLTPANITTINTATQEWVNTEIATTLGDIESILSAL